MKLINRISPVVLFLLLVSGCEHQTEPVESHHNPWWKTEQTVRSQIDRMATFHWSDYPRLMTVLSENKFVVLPINEMRSYFDTNKVVVGLRHDVDGNPFKALEMAEIEKGYGIRSTYFILATSSYYGRFEDGKVIRNEGMDSLYKRISDTGAEIGIHNDLLTVMIQYKTDPFEFNTWELDFYKALGISIYGTASHGSEIAKETVPNYEIFSDFAKQAKVDYMGSEYPLGIKSLKDFGFDYESYFIDYKIYYSDSRGLWNDPEGLNGILDKLEGSKPGDRIQILAHPDWWGKN